MANRMLKNKKMERQQKHRWVFTAVNVLTLLLAVYLINRLFPQGAPKQVSYSEFLGELRSGNLTDVQITERELIGVSKDDPAHPKPPRERTITATRLPGVDESLLLKELEAHPVKFGGHIERTSWVWSALAWLFPFLFIAFIYAVGMRRISQAERASDVRQEPGQDLR